MWKRRSTTLTPLHSGGVTCTYPTNTQTREGEESSDVEEALDRFDPLVYMWSYVYICTYIHI